MTITLCGSMKFNREMLEIKSKLEEMGHKVITPENMQKPVTLKTHSEKAFTKIKHGLIKLHYKKIKKSDAILVVNLNKKTENYIGGSTFIEMAFAHVLEKKIYLLNPIPKVSFRDEIIAMRPMILKGDLGEI